MKGCIRVLVGLCLASSALAQSWVPSGNGSWNSAGNWHSPASVPDGSGAVVLITNDYAAAVTLTLDNSTPFTVNRLTYDDLGAANDVACFINAGSGGAGAGLVFAGTLPTISNNVDLTIGVPVNLSLGLSKWGGRNAFLTNTVSGFSSLVYNAVYANMLAIGPLNPIDWTTINKTTGGGTLRLDAISVTNVPAAFSVAAGELQLNPSTGTYAFTNVTGFTKTGAGSLRLNNRNASGPGGSATLQVAAGSLGFGANLSGFASANVASGGALQPNGGVTYTSMPLTLAGNGGGNTYGALYFNSGGSTTVTWPGAITLASGGSTIGSYGVTYNTTLSGVISGTGPLTIAGRGGSDATHNATFNLNAAATYSGNTTLFNNDGIANCTLKLGVSDALPTSTALAMNITDPVLATSTTLDLNGKNQQLAGLSRIGSAAPGKYRVVNTSATASTLTLNTASATSFDGSLGISGGANFSLVKQGNATLTLSGTNCAYSGGTTVSAGTLLINSAVASGTGSVTVNGGTLAGTGTVRGGSTVNSGGTLAGTLTVQGAVSTAAGAVITPGGSATVGALTLQSNLSLTGAALTFDVPSSGANDSIAVAGDFALNGANTLALNLLNGSLPAGTYTLLTYATQSGSGSLTLDPAPRNATLTVGLTSVTLDVAAGGTGLNLTWVGGSGNLWDINTSAFWNNGAGADVFFDLDSVLFDDAGSASPAIDLTTTVRPTSVVVSNGVNAYTFSGVGGLAGASTLTKWGTNTLTLANANTHSGATIIRAGRLAYGVNDAIGAGAVTVTGSTSVLLLGTFSDTVGTVTVEGGASITGTSGSLSTTSSIDLKGGTVSAIIAGSGAVSASTASASTLSGANTYTGPTSVGVFNTSGTALNVNHASALGATTAGTTVNGGTGTTENKVVLGNGITVADETLTLEGGPSGYRAALRYASAGSATWDGNIVLASGPTYIGSDNGGGTLVVGLSGEDTITGAASSLSFRGGGTVTVNSRLYIPAMAINRDDYGTVVINSTNNVCGTLNINQGIIRLGASDALPATLALNIGKNSGVNNNAVLDLNGKSQTIASLADLHYYPSNGTQRIISALPATLIVNNTAANSFGKDGSTIEGGVSLVKAGTGSLLLTGTNVNSGAYIVSNGTLTVSATGTFGANSAFVSVAGGTLTLSNSVVIADSATLRIADGGGAKVNLAGVSETVGYLLFGDNEKQAGTYGASGSGATFINDEHFLGTGTLNVLHGYGGTMILLN
jgi:autotransporter-associated beta strand protein